MEEAIALIDKLVEEHKLIRQRIGNIESVANDAEALGGLDKAKDAFMPGKLEQSQGLKRLQELVKIAKEGLDAHFNREETALLSIVEKYGSKESASALRSLLLEHADLRNRFAHAERHVAELVSGGLSRNLWEASAHDMRAHISHTRQLIEAHAGIEQELFHRLRSELAKQQKK